MAPGGRDPSHKGHLSIEIPKEEGETFWGRKWYRPGRAASQVLVGSFRVGKDQQGR